MYVCKRICAREHVCTHSVCVQINFYHIYIVLQFLTVKHSGHKSEHSRSCESSWFVWQEVWRGQRKNQRSGIFNPITVQITDMHLQFIYLDIFFAHFTKLCIVSF